MSVWKFWRALAGVLVLSACSQASEPGATPYMREGLAAYRAGDRATVKKMAETLERVGENAIENDATTVRVAYGGAARLRALKAVLETRPTVPLLSLIIYAERLCDADTWAETVLPATDAKQTGCDGQSAFSSWRIALLASNPIAYFDLHARAALVENGYLLPSPHAVAGIPPYVTVTLLPLKRH